MSDLVVVIISGNKKEKVYRLLDKLYKTKYSLKKFKVYIFRDSKCELIKYKKRNLFQKKYSFSGMSKARNDAIKKIPKTKIVAFIDDDALPKTDWITNIVDFFKKNRKANVLMGAVINRKNKSLISEYITYFGVHDIGKYGQLIGANMAFRYSILKKISHDERFLRGYDDFDFSKQLEKIGERLYTCNKVDVEHDDLTSFRVLVRKRFNSSKYSILYFNKYRENPFNVDDVLVIALFFGLLTIFSIQGAIVFIISIIFLGISFNKQMKNATLKTKIKLIGIFILERMARTAGKFYGLSKWGFVRCKRS